MNCLRFHRARIDVPDLFPRHCRDWKFDASLHGVESDVTMRVVHHDRAFGADQFDPGRGEIGISRRKHPSGADSKYTAVMERHHDPGAIRNIVGGLHDFAYFLCVNANWLPGRKAPKHEIDVVRSLHRCGRELDAPPNFLSQIPGDVPADKCAYGLTDRTIIDRSFYVSELRIKSLGIPNREQQLLGAREANQIVSLGKLECNWLFEKHMFAGLEALLRHGIMRSLRRGRNHDRVN